MPVMNSRRLRAAAIATLLLAGSVGESAAHARVKRANPPVGGKVSVSNAPSELQVWFSEAVVPAHSSIHVFAPDGTQVDTGEVRGDEEDKTELKVTLQPLRPNIYRVIWNVLSVDTHRRNGSFPFRVEP